MPSAGELRFANSRSQLPQNDRRTYFWRAVGDRLICRHTHTQFTQNAKETNFLFQPIINLKKRNTMLVVLREYANLFYWSTLFHLNSLFLRFVYTVAPFAALKNRIIGILGTVGVKVTCDKDEIVGTKLDKSKYKVELVVKDDRFFYKVFDASLGVGEAYMDGMIECDDIPALLSCLAKLPPKNGRYLEEKMLMARNRQGISESMKLIEVHYNLGNDLYENMLDKNMSYTCGCWYPETKTLEEAQNNKHDLIGRKLKLKPGMKVLDIGGGFGAAAKYLAQNFGVSVTIYNISKEQVKYGRENCKDVDVTFIMADYRTATGQFDAIYSIGFFEAVGTQNFRGYFELIDRCLKPEGLALTHTIISADKQMRAGRWINKYIFPGGELPHMRDLLIASAPMLITEDVQSFAKSYAKTLHCWNANFVKNWGNIKSKYEPMVDGKFYRMWTWYLGVCEGAFLARAVQLTQIVHSKFDREEEYYSVRDKRV